MKHDKEFLEFCKNLGKNVTKLRKKKNLSIEEFSKLTGIRKEYLLKIENGKAFGIKFHAHLEKMAGALDVKLHQFFD